MVLMKIVTLTSLLFLLLWKRKMIFRFIFIIIWESFHHSMIFRFIFIIRQHLKGNCHEQLTWKRQPELFKFDSRRHRCKAKPPAYDGTLAAKERTLDKRADSVNEKWPENIACCHKPIYLNACAAHDSFPLNWQYYWMGLQSHLLMWTTCTVFQVHIPGRSIRNIS